MKTKSIGLVDRRLEEQIEYFRARHMANAYVKTENRQETRFPVNLPAQLAVPNASLSVIVRDISPSGIGLSHEYPIPLGDATLRMPTDLGVFEAQIEIVWCHTPHEQAYFSGARIVRVLDIDSNSKLSD